MVSQQDIADRLHLSRSLVTKVLNGNLGTTKVRPETAQAILDLAARLGYKPNPTAVSLATGRQGTIGVLVRRFGTPASRLADVLTDGISEEARLTKQKLVLTFYNNETETRCFELLTESRGIDGLLFAGRLHPRIAAELTHFDAVPVVSVCGEPISPRVSHVAIDVQGIGYAGTRHLIERGCRRIAYIKTHEDRMRGWRLALEEASISPDESLLLQVHSHGHDDGAAAVSHFISSGVTFDGFAAQSDVQAAGAINELLRRGIRVPEDVKVIGVDNAPFCEFFTCPITSVDPNFREAGRLAMQMLMQAIIDPTAEPRHVTVQPVVVQRRSTE
ncbi:MAG: LacI family DNA-binding transcriptional regulator [Planctomycetes bacterium]|nr:LacI family DNA-binding transcriptional regulator [Planctomycetota bacterium]